MRTVAVDSIAAARQQLENAKFHLAIFDVQLPTARGSICATGSPMIRDSAACP